MTVAVGDAGDPNDLGIEHDCLGCGNTTYIMEVDPTDRGDGLYDVGNTCRHDQFYVAVTALIAEFTSDGAHNLAQLTTGEIEIYVSYYSVPNW